MFKSQMARKLSSLCPRLELLAIEIDCIKQFGDIFNHLRNKSNLTELKFIQAFSRDTMKTWPSWLNEGKQFDDSVTYEVKIEYLLIWL